MTRRVELAIQRVGTRVAPDRRVEQFDVDVSVDDGRVRLTGIVADDCARRAVLAAAEESTDRPVEDRIRVPRCRPVCAVEGVVAVRGEPTEGAEQVTQLVFGGAAELLAVGSEEPGWERVRAPDGYVGWVPSGSICRRHGTGDAVLLRDVQPGGEGLPETLYAGTPCRLLDGDPETVGPPSVQPSGRVAVGFATGDSVTVPVSAVTAPEGPPDGQRIVEHARRYAGTPYEWGGMTGLGIDCSGLVWMAYRMEGIVLPRDTDQQRRMGRHVGGDDLVPGDLLFFPGHVGVSTGGTEFVHADGEAGVVTGSLDPDHPEFTQDRAETFGGARRLCPPPET